MWTNRGIKRLFDYALRGAAWPTNMYVALVTEDSYPDRVTKIMSELTEIADGNGYNSGGYEINLNDTDWDSLTENDETYIVGIQLKDVAWTASGGPIPASGDGVRYAVLTDDNETAADREIYAVWDLESVQTLSDTQTLTLLDLELRGVQIE